MSNGRIGPPWWLMGRGTGGSRTVSGAVAHWEDKVVAPLRSLLVNIEPVQEGTGDPSPDNVRPISGWSAVNVWRTGANVSGGDALATAILDSCTSGASKSGNIVTLPNGSTNVNSTTADRVRILEDKFEPGQYTIIIKQDSSTATKALFTVYYTDGTSTSLGMSQLDSTGKYWRLVTNANKTVSFIRMNRDETGIHTYDVSKSGIFKGDVPLEDFTPYQGQSVTLQLGQTVYDGTLDVTNGVLTVDRALKTLTGDEVWYEYPSFNGYYVLIGNMKVGYRQDGISNMLVDSKTTTSGQKNSMWLGVNTRNLYVIGVYETMGSTLADFKAYLTANNLQVVYPLATPITIPLTPQEISTLQGTNNLWADTGDVTVTYLSGEGNPALVALALAHRIEE